MKRDAPSEWDGEERSANARRRECSIGKPELLETENDNTESLQPISQLSPQFDNTNPATLNPQDARPTSLTNANTELGDGIYEWIPAPSDIDDLETMNQPASKVSRSRSTSKDWERARSLSSENSEGSSIWDTRSAVYADDSYATILEMKGCFEQESPAGPMPEDIALCERLLHQPIETPRGTMFEDECMKKFHHTLHSRSEERLLVDLHPLIMPSAENQFIKGNQSLKDVIDGYNNLWLKTEPIYGPRPQPDHARGLKWSTFSESQRHKLGIQPDETSPYTAREDMYFPYLTAEIQYGDYGLGVADCQNMHSMCVAMRAVVSLCQAAGCMEELHRKILAFSISHELNFFRIYGYYPEVKDGQVSYYRWPVAGASIWSKENRWTCYRFVQNLDREFLPIHTNRLMRMLEQLPDPSGDSDLLESQLPGTGSQDQPGSRRAASSQNRGLQPELRMMVQTSKQRLAEQRAREEKREAEWKERESEQKAREGTLLAQLEQQRKEQNLLQERLFALLEQNIKSK
ncbi:hypothetical protein N7456_006457 [Penicillium angulare]|uniref:DUF7924 domain-containing protein n=1 Tax=Penicillium angulare TaxID=116970 RepID=A0A9W9FHU9_9EURO|nr:hypothetical protein N7456_006457 [Penicillium angulare]